MEVCSRVPRVSKPKTNDVPMRIRRRQSDARWRANVASCFETLKNIIPVNKRASKRQISKAYILQETSKHITFLEGILYTLMQEKAKVRGFESDNWNCPEKFEAVKDNFVTDQRDKLAALNNERKYKRNKYKIYISDNLPYANDQRGCHGVFNKKKQTHSSGGPSSGSSSLNPPEKAEIPVTKRAGPKLARQQPPVQVIVRPPKSMEVEQVHCKNCQFGMLPFQDSMAAVSSQNPAKESTLKLPSQPLELPRQRRQKVPRKRAVSVGLKKAEPKKQKRKYTMTAINPVGPSCMVNCEEKDGITRIPYLHRSLPQVPRGNVYGSNVNMMNMGVQSRPIETVKKIRIKNGVQKEVAQPCYFQGGNEKRIDQCYHNVQYKLCDRPTNPPHVHIERCQGGFLKNKQETHSVEDNPGVDLPHEQGSDQQPHGFRPVDGTPAKMVNGPWSPRAAYTTPNEAYSTPNEAYSTPNEASQGLLLPLLLLSPLPDASSQSSTANVACTPVKAHQPEDTKKEGAFTPVILPTDWLTTPVGRSPHTPEDTNTPVSYEQKRLDCDEDISSEEDQGNAGRNSPCGRSQSFHHRTSKLHRAHPLDESGPGEKRKKSVSRRHENLKCRRSLNMSLDLEDDNNSADSSALCTTESCIQDFDRYYQKLKESKEDELCSELNEVMDPVWALVDESSSPDVYQHTTTTLYTKKESDNPDVEDCFNNLLSGQLDDNAKDEYLTAEDYGMNDGAPKTENTSQTVPESNAFVWTDCLDTQLVPTQPLENEIKTEQVTERRSASMDDDQENQLVPEHGFYKDDEVFNTAEVITFIKQQLQIDGIAESNTTNISEVGDSTQQLDPAPPDISHIEVVEFLDQIDLKNVAMMENKMQRLLQSPYNHCLEEEDPDNYCIHWEGDLK